MPRRSVRIEDRPGGHYSVVKDRGDGVAFSVGLVDTKTEARKLKSQTKWAPKKR